MVYKQLEERHVSRPSINLTTLNKMKASGEKIATITAYDASFAKLVDDAGIEMVLVGDSLGMVIQGHDTTVPVTLNDIIYHCKAVAKGMYRPFLMADMPFMSYTSREQALENAVRLMQEGGAKIVKLEAGAKQIGIVEFLAVRQLNPSSVGSILCFAGPPGVGSATGPAIRVTRAPAFAAAAAMAKPCLPEERLAMTRTGSIGS